jgi:hypothetical protein
MPRDMGLFSAAAVFSFVFVHQHAAYRIPNRTMLHYQPGTQPLAV